MLIVATGKGIKKHVNQEVYNKKTKNKAYLHMSKDLSIEGTVVPGLLLCSK